MELLGAATRSMTSRMWVQEETKTKMKQQVYVQSCSLARQTDRQTGRDRETKSSAKSSMGCSDGNNPGLNTRTIRR